MDTSAISALFDKKNPERQLLTQQFFERLAEFDTYVSEVVLAEIDNTRDADLRRKLRDKAVSFKLLAIDDESRALAEKYVRLGAVPSDYPEDALHISIATVNDMDRLLSWNFQHLVRVKTRRIVSMVNASRGYRDLEIMTPAEVL